MYDVHHQPSHTLCSSHISDSRHVQEYSRCHRYQKSQINQCLFVVVVVTLFGNKQQNKQTVRNDCCSVLADGNGCPQPMTRLIDDMSASTWTNLFLTSEVLCYDKWQARFIAIFWKGKLYRRSKKYTIIMLTLLLSAIPQTKNKSCTSINTFFIVNYFYFRIVIFSHIITAMII